MFPGTSEWLPAMFRGTVLLSAAACVVGALIWALRIRAANLRWRAWFAVLVCGLGFVPLTVQLPWREANAPPALTADRVADIALPRTVELNGVPGEQESPDSEVADETEFEPIDEPEVPAAQAIAPTLQVVEAAPNEPSAASSWPRALLGVWLAGMIAIFARGVWRYGRFLRSLRHCVAAPSEWANAWRTLLGEARVRRDVPMLVGEHYGPALCRLPRGYALVVPRTMWERTPANARDVILRHELAHYLRNDLTWSLIARWLAAPHWFNPLAHLAVRRLDEASEWACDDAATGGQADRQLLLSKTLLELSESSGAPGAMQAAVSGNVLALRIRRLLEPNIPKERKMKRGLLTLALAGCVATGLLRFELVAQEQSPAPASDVKAAPTVARELLRYDGKSFDAWRALLQTEFSPERRLVAVEAIGELGRQGYGPEAAAMLVGMLRIHAEDVGASNAKSKLRHAIEKEIRRISPQVTVPLLVEILQHGNEAEKDAVIGFCHVRLEKKAEQAAPALIEVALDESLSPVVRFRALHCVTDIAPDSEGLQEAFQRLLDPENSPLEVRRHAISAAWECVHVSESQRLAQRILPLVVKSLDDEDAVIRESAMGVLAESGPSISVALPELLEPMRRVYEEAMAIEQAPEAERAARNAKLKTLESQYYDRFQILVEHAGLHTSSHLRNCCAKADSVDQKLLLNVLRSVVEYKSDVRDLLELDAFFDSLAGDTDPEVVASAANSRKDIAKQLEKIGRTGERDVFEKLKAEKQRRERDSAQRTR